MSFDIDVHLARGEAQIDVRFAAPTGLTALFGPSGAGKTSVLDMVAGLVRPDSGRIVVGGEVLFDSTAGIDLPPQRRGCGYIFQDLRLFPHLRVRDNLLFGWRRAHPGMQRHTLDEVVGFLGIGHLLDRRPVTLSGGEAQRVAIGRALLSGARFLLMDEPLSSLDSARRDEILGVVESLRDGFRLPILYVSHDRSEVERLAGTVVNLPQPR